MLHAQIFFNTTIKSEYYAAGEYRSLLEQFTFSGKAKAKGNRFLSPVRCLFKGSDLTIFHKDGKLSVEKRPSFPQRTWLQLIAAIVFLIPGVILGSILKGVSYIGNSTQSKEFRKDHQTAVLFFSSKNISDLAQGTFF